MTPEQNNNLPWIENKEQISPTIDSLKQDIQENLSSLSKLNEDSDSMNTLKNLVEQYGDNLDALTIIDGWLKEITDEVASIKNQWERQISEMTWSMIKGLEELDNWNDVDDVEAMLA